MRLKLGLIAIGGAIVAVTTAASHVIATRQSVARIGPFYTSTLAFDTAAGGQVGGQVRFYKNGVDTMIIGDVVYVSANNTVRKSATLANYNTIAGVVVGGTTTNMQAVTSLPLSTDTASKANQQVIVLQCGRAYVRIDAATGIAPGALIQPGTTTAGKVTVKAAPIDSLYRVLGRLVDTGIVSTQVLANVCIK